MKRPKIIDFAADIIMPTRCPCCGGFIMWNEKLCEKCLKSLPLCGSEERPPEGCSAAVSVFAFDGPAKEGIYSLKDGWGRAFAEYAAEIISERLRGCGAELVTCVPMSRRKKASRGWDQAEVIAKEFAEALGLPCDLSLLRRRYSRTEQHGLSAAGRAEFASGQYSIAPDHADISGKHIILADDVITTGSTVSACASLLLSMGAADVIAASVCRTLKRQDG